MIKKNLIPQELINLNQWVGWEPEFNEKIQKWIKQPYTIYKTIYARTNDPQSWSSFDLLENYSTHEGIGFVFHDSDPYCFIDLDNVVVDGEILPEFQTIIDKAIERNGWIERSVSGNGFHIILKGWLPKGRSKQQVELFPKGRFIAMTLDVVNNPETIGDGQDLIDELVETYYPDTKKSKQKTKSEKPVKPITDNEDLPTYKMKLGKDIETAFKAIDSVEHGDTVEFDTKAGRHKEYPSRSEAEGFIVTRALACGYSKKDIYGLFNEYNVGTFSEAPNKAHYIDVYYNNAKYNFYNDDTRNEISLIDVYTLPLTKTGKRQEANVRATLDAIVQVGIRFGTYTPMISVRDIGGMINVAKSTVQKAVNKLVEEGYLAILEKGSSGISSKYQILIKSNVRRSNNNREYVRLLKYSLERSEHLLFNLLNEPMTFDEIVKKYGRSEITTYKTLKSLIDKNLVLFENDVYTRLDDNVALFKEEVDYFMKEKRQQIKEERLLNDAKRKYYGEQNEK